MAEKAPIPAFRPLFAQIKELIIERLEAGEWNQGEPLPSEGEFAAYYQVSQGTVRKAISEMADENMVVRFRGKGTFVASHTAESVRSRFFHLHHDSGTKDLPGSQPLSCRRLKSTPDIETRLQLASGTDVVMHERLRILRGQPVALETIIVPESLFPEMCSALADALPNEFYPYYEAQFGIRVVRALEQLRGVLADQREAELLNLSGPGAPLLEIDRLAVAYGDRPVEWRRSRCNTANHFYLSILD